VATTARGRRPPERGEALEAQLEFSAPDLAREPGDFARGGVVDVADETQGEVIVLRIDPARAREPAALHTEF
jgi:hypothetical protein